MITGDIEMNAGDAPGLTFSMGGELIYLMGMKIVVFPL
jgi:hypothetical protein